VYKVVLGSWIFVDTLHIQWSFCFDSLTAVMLVVVTFISFLVHLYSIEYMRTDPHLLRFMSYLSVFTFFMLILITANNFLQMFVGWEGVGVSSFLLINFWFTRLQANKSAIKAMLVNRVGDFFILVAMFLIFFFCNSLDYDIVFNLASTLNKEKITIMGFDYNILTLICFCLFLGAMGKSAQLGLHIWLPDAMEGPTPVSALIHAATMVTAGVFLIARCSFFFELAPVILNFIAVIGALTTFFAATTGLFQNDIKKVIAYSTCSQLGYMVFACGLSAYDVAIFHLFNHAFFKALLFLSAGSLIHAVANEQDMRKMGGLRQKVPLSYMAFVIGSLALTGFPFLAGFYSKDIILEIAASKYTVIGHFCFFLGVFSAFFTALYSMRILILVFLAGPNGNRVVLQSTHEGTKFLVVPLFILLFWSIIIGFLTKDFLIGFGTDFWGSSLYILPENYLINDIEFLDIQKKLLPLAFTILGLVVGIFLYIFNSELFFNLKLKKVFFTFYKFFNKKWFIDRLYTQLITQSVLQNSYWFTYRELDRGFLEMFGPFGVTLFVQDLQNQLKIYQSGNVFHYIFLFGFTIFFFTLFLLIF
jgi:NADH-ubiquinone oxidoreductase chain 5